MRIPSFIVTLAGMLVFKGLALALLQGQSVGPFPNDVPVAQLGLHPRSARRRIGASFLAAARGARSGGAGLVQAGANARAPAKHGMEAEPTAFFFVKNGDLRRLDRRCQLAAVHLQGPAERADRDGCARSCSTTSSPRAPTVGRRIYALGGNEKAARLSGIKTDRLAFYTFVNMGVLAALAGLVFAARLNTATPKAGLGFELDVIAACFIGGASASGGVGKVIGAVIGAFIMGVMNNGMSILGIGIDYQQVIKGLVLLAAVFVDIYNKNK